MAARGPQGGRGGSNNRFAQFKLVLLGMTAQMERINWRVKANRFDRRVCSRKGDSILKLSIMTSSY